jgi:hypothetical protein
MSLTTYIHPPLQAEEGASGEGGGGRTRWYYNIHEDNDELQYFLLTGASSGQPAAFSGQPAASRGQPAASSGQPAASSGQPAANDSPEIGIYVWDSRCSAAGGGQHKVGDPRKVSDHWTAGGDQMTAGDQRKVCDHWMAGNPRTASELTTAATSNGGHRTRLTNEGKKKADVTGQISGGEDKLEATPEIGQKVPRFSSTVRVGTRYSA